MVISIFGLISMVGLASYSQFNSRTLLDSLAYDIALSLRQAQSYGLSVREGSSGGGFNSGYGIYFDKDNNTSYIFFADVDNNFQFNNIPCGLPGSECIDSFTLGSGYKISDICGIFSNLTERCTSTDSSLKGIAVVFKRPDPDAFLNSNPLGDKYQEVRVTVASTKGVKQSIFVATTGQISVGKGLSIIGTRPIALLYMSGVESFLSEKKSNYE